MTPASGNGGGLRIRDLSGGYGKGPVVSQVSFEVPQGGSLLLVGHNGAGKTTILRSIMGLCPAFAGEVVVNGVNLTGATPARRAASGVSYVMQERGTFRGLSVAENLELVARLSGLRSPADRARRYGQVFEWFPRIAQRMSSMARSLSGGESRMLAVACGLLRNPEVMLLDEPTLGLAPATAEGMIATLARIQAETGLAMVVTESGLTAARQLKSELRVVRRGRVSDAMRGDAEISSLDEVL